MICIGGWFPQQYKSKESGKGKEPKKEPPELFALFGQYLGSGYVYSIVRVDPKDLVVTDDCKYVGGFFDTEKVRGISDVSTRGPLFYVLEKNVAAINFEISKVAKEPVIM